MRCLTNSGDIKSFTNNKTFVPEHPGRVSSITKTIIIHIKNIDAVGDGKSGVSEDQRNLLCDFLKLDHVDQSVIIHQTN